MVQWYSDCLYIAAAVWVCLKRGITRQRATWRCPPVSDVQRLNQRIFCRCESLCHEKVPGPVVALVKTIRTSSSGVLTCIWTRSEPLSPHANTMRLNQSACLEWTLRYIFIVWKVWVRFVFMAERKRWKVILVNPLFREEELCVWQEPDNSILGPAGSQHLIWRWHITPSQVLANEWIQMTI